MITPDELATLRDRIANDAMAKANYNALKVSGEKMIRKNADGSYDESRLQRVVIEGRLLEVSRQALIRVSLVAGLYLLDGDPKWIDFARRDLLDVCNFSDWNPSHFLDVAEMTMAVAIGYDWLYNELTISQRETIRNAIISKGLNPGLTAFNNRAFWVKAHTNWGQVCNGGLGVGALSIAAEAPDVAQQILNQVPVNLKEVMKLYAPDGAGDEGVNYWSYGTMYTVQFIDAAQSALGEDFALIAMPGFENTGSYYIQMQGPLGKSFNYSDQGDSPATAPSMFWLSNTFNNPYYSQFEFKRGRGGIWGLLWYNPDMFTQTSSKLPLNAYFGRVENALFRSAWDQTDAFYVGFKGGDNAFNHPHLDLGSFVFDAMGQRWAIDVGMMNYSLPGIWNSSTQTGQRFTYYRVKTEGHNTLTISSQTQEPLNFANQYFKGKAPIVAFKSSKDRSFAVTDMTDAYRSVESLLSNGAKWFDDRRVTKAWRGMAFLNNNQVLIQDEVTAEVPVDIVWNFHTKAAVRIDGNVAILTQGGKTMKVEILAPTSGASFQTIASDPIAQRPSWDQNAGANSTNLIIRLAQKTTKATIAVRLIPEGSTDTAPPVESLAYWIDEANDPVKQVPSLAVASVKASEEQDPNLAANTLDDNLTTRWSAQGDGQWIQYDLGSIKKVSHLNIGFYAGNIRTTSFDIKVSINGRKWLTVFSGSSSGTTLQQEKFDFNNIFARYVRIVGHGNSQSDWNSITEVDVYGPGRKHNSPEDTLAENPDTNPNKILAYPVPATDVIHVGLFSSKAQTIRMQLINTLSEVMLTEEQEAEQGDQQLILHVDYLPTGIYFLSVEKDDTRIVKRIIIRR